MPNYIRQWKINNQIADLRDGTKGQPNGAIPLDSNGKIAYSLLKVHADEITVSRTNSDRLTKWMSNVACYTHVPTDWRKTASGTYQMIKYVGNFFIAVGASGIIVSTNGEVWQTTNVTSFSGTVTIECIECLGGIYYVGCNLGLWASTDAVSWTRVSDTAVTHIAYDGTRYVANFYIEGKYLANSTDGFTWTADTFFSSLGSLNLSGHSVYGVWYVDGIWWLNAYYAAGNDYTLFFYDGTHFSIPVTVGSILGLKWKAIHRTHNIDGLLQGDVWVIASEGANNQSKIYLSETLYGVEWRHSTTIPGVTTDFIEHKGVLYIGNTSGIAYMDPVGNYWFYTRRLSDVIGQNPCQSICTIENFLLVCGGTKMLYSIDALRFYRGIISTSCYSMAVGNNRAVICAYNSTLNNSLITTYVYSKEPLYL